MLIEVGRIEAGDSSTVAGLLDWVLAAGDVQRWCNLDLEIDEDEHVADSVLFGFLAARGPSSPFATVMSAVGGRRPAPPEVGVQHRAGPRSAEQLLERGVALPEGWLVRQDHPRRGLVVQLPDDVSALALGAWLVAAMDALNRARTTGAFRFESHEVT